MCIRDSYYSGYYYDNYYKSREDEEESDGTGSDNKEIKDKSITTEVGSSSDVKPKY